MIKVLVFILLGLLASTANGQLALAPKSRSKTIKAFSSLKAALSDKTTENINLGADITVEESILIPQGKTITSNSWRLVEKEKDVSILFYGELNCGRSQVFEGFEPGDIKGTFSTNRVFPEWWGLVGSNYDDGRHEIAINSAINSYQMGWNGNTVSLAAGIYYVGGPIDLRGSASKLVGAGSGATRVNATKNWKPDKWDSSNFWSYWKKHGQAEFIAVENKDGKALFKFAKGGTSDFVVGGEAEVTDSKNYNGKWDVLEIPDESSMVLNVKYEDAPFEILTGLVTPVTLDSVMESGPESHSAMIWIGGKTKFPSSQTFFTGVEGLSVSAYYPIRKFPNKRISGISWTGYVEELSFIRDVGVVSFSGFGIGGAHPSNITTVNGLTASNFFLSDATRRGAVGFFAAGHGGVVAIRDGTMDFRVDKSESTEGNSEYKKTWPQFGILAAGAHTDINNIHFESVGNAIHVYSWGGAGSVTISNCDLNHGMDWRMRYHGDDFYKIKDQPALLKQEMDDNYKDTHRFMFHNSCLVSLGRTMGEYNAGSNYNSNVSIRNIRTLDNSVYLLRDWQYGIHVYGNGSYRNPNEGGNSITSYDRGIPFGPPEGLFPNQKPGKFYSPFNPPLTDREYFKLIR